MKEIVLYVLLAISNDSTTVVSYHATSSACLAFKQQIYSTRAKPGRENYECKLGEFPVLNGQPIIAK